MSFLNPISEPVKRYDSTDDQAPQIQYNGNEIGVIKTIFKACLDTGYGTKQGAGWACDEDANDSNIATFTSPNVAMSRYKLHVDDTASNKTLFNYTEDGVLKSFANNSQNKLEATKKQNSGWTMLVTEQGFWFIEYIEYFLLPLQSARVTYFGRMKTAFDDLNTNICLISFGTSSFFNKPCESIISTANIILPIQNFFITSNSVSLLKCENVDSFASVVDIIDKMYVVKDERLVAEVPGINIIAPADKSANNGGVYESQYQNRNVLSIFSAEDTANALSYDKYSVRSYIYLDYWEY